MTDEKTVYQNYPKPHKNNKLNIDVERIRDAFDQMDEDVNELKNSNGSGSGSIPGLEADGDALKFKEKNLATEDFVTSGYQTKINQELGTANEVTFKEITLGEGNDVTKKIYSKEGKLGIGTKKPEKKLHIAGEALITEDLKVDGNVVTTSITGVVKEGEEGRKMAILADGGVSVQGNIQFISGYGFISSSDRKLKENIEDEQDILQRLEQLNVKNYHRKNQPKTAHKEIGFIAQEVLPLFPSLVTEITNEDPEQSDSHLALNYAAFGAIAIGAIKELRKEKEQEINALKSTIKELKQENKFLKNNMTELKQVVEDLMSLFKE